MLRVEKEIDCSVTKPRMFEGCVEGSGCHVLKTGKSQSFPFEFSLWGSDGDVPTLHVHTSNTVIWIIRCHIICSRSRTNIIMLSWV